MSEREPHNPFDERDWPMPKEQRDWIIGEAAKNATEAMRVSLEKINRRASPSAERTFDQAIRDLEWITAEARAALAGTTEYPEGITASDHIAHDMKMGRFPEQSSVETFLAERKKELIERLREYAKDWRVRASDASPVLEAIAALE